MENEFIPHNLALELKELGFDEKCLTSYANDGDLMSVWNTASDYQSKMRMIDEENTAYVINSVDFKNSGWCAAPLYQQVFRWFREKYNFRYSIGDTNIAVVHVGTTFLLQNNATYTEAEIAAIEKFIDVAKQL